MQNIPYAYVAGSLMYAQVCIRSDIAFMVRMLGRYKSNPRMDHWRATKKVMRYLKDTKDYMQNTDGLRILRQLATQI